MIELGIGFVFGFILSLVYVRYGFIIKMARGRRGGRRNGEKDKPTQ